MSHTRATIFRIDSTERLPSGALRVEGNLTKTGVFNYSFNGETIREARQDTEVFSPESLDTLKGVPVTVEHPSRFVGTDNWSLLSVGHVVDFQPAPPYVKGEMLIFDEKAIREIEDGRLVEISMGYTTSVQPREDAADHDFAQTEIRYNHLALGPSGWGRLGSDVGLRLDSNHDLEFGDFQMTERKDATADEIVEAKEDEAQIEGQEATPVEDAPEATPEETPAEAAGEEAPEAVEDEAPEVPAVTLDSIKAILDQHGELLARLTAEPAPAEKTDSNSTDVDSQVSERVDRALKVRDAHAKICPDSPHADRSTRELCLEALAHVDSDVDEGASDEILEAKVEAAAAATPEARESLTARLLGHPTPAQDAGFAARLLDRDSD